MKRALSHRSGSLVAAGLLALWLAAPALAAAGPQPKSSDPAEGAQLHEPPETVSIEFDQPLDSTSEIKVVDECDRRLDDGTTDVSLTTMSVDLDTTPAGEYTVSFTAVGVGGVTGTTEGDYKFHVHLGKTCTGATAHHHHGAGHAGHNAGHHSGHSGHSGHQGHGSHHGAHSEHAAGHVPGAHDHSALGHAGHLAGAHLHHALGAEHHHHHSGSLDGGGFDQAAGAGPRIAPSRPISADGAALLTAFALAGALGTLGGFMLRNSRTA